GSPEFVISMITFWKKYLEGSDSLIARPLVYEFIEALIPFTFHYEGCVRPEIIQLALDQITSLEQDLKQDANLPETVQGTLKELNGLSSAGGNGTDSPAKFLELGIMLHAIYQSLDES
ncbi:hypothetical protein V496_02526, partial [Pseudogymnoascus sp. VKM F-4515 (FW-2607)]